MTMLAFARYEVLRTFRNVRFFILSVAFPFAIYLLTAIPNRDVTNLAGTGIPAPLYFMVGLIAFGTMAAMLSSGTRIATERASGWARQLRLTPLPAGAYIRTKIAIAYVMALITMALLFAAGLALGVSLPLTAWLQMIGLVLVALIPFAAFGIWLGHVVSPDAIAPAVGATTAALSFVSGAWFPLGHGGLEDFARHLPSYWLVQASRVALSGDAWPAQGWYVVAAWSVAIAVLAGRAYRRNTQRA